MPLSRLLGRISGILHDGRWSGGHCGHLRVGLFNFSSLLPVRGMLNLHRFQVDETREIGFDRDREDVDVEVFYCGLCRSGRMDRHVYTVKGITAVRTAGFVLDVIRKAATAVQDNKAA